MSADTGMSINRSRHARTTVKRARTLAWRALEASGNPGDGSGLHRVLADRFRGLGLEILAEEIRLLRRHYFLRARKMGNWTNWARGSTAWAIRKAVSDFGMGSTEIAPSTNGAPLNSLDWKKNAEARRRRARIRGVHGNLRHARDREEFERFMDEHRNQQERRPGNRARS